MSINMRKTILYIGMSLDGYIADKNGKVDWLEGQEKSYESDYGYKAFSQTVDTVIMGYRTYNQIVTELSPEEWVYPDMNCYVITNKKLPSTTNITFTNQSLKNLITTLKKQDGKHIWICGGADIAQQCIAENMIDEYHLSIIPTILGDGIRLFGKNEKAIPLELISLSQENGIIDGIYRPTTNKQKK